MASTLVSIVYPDEGTAEKAMGSLESMEKQYLVDLQSAVYATKDPDGKVKVHNIERLTGAEATWGAFWGLLFGLLFFVPVLGVAIGAGLGALFGHFTQIGLDENFVKGISEKMKPGTSAVFMLISGATTDRFTDGLKQFGGEVLQTNLPHDAEEKLQAALKSAQTPAS
jgi:uncharacterized membrane protein